VKYCPECGQRLDKGTEKFCPECGEGLVQAATPGRYDNKKSSIGITDTKGDVLGTDVTGSENVIAKDIHGNIIQLQVTNLSYTDLQKIITTPIQVDTSHDVKTSNEDKKGIKKIQETTTITSQQTNKIFSEIFDEINRVEKKERTHIQYIKAGGLRISRKELLVKEYDLKGNELYYKKQYNKNTDSVTTFLEERCILDLGNPEYYTITTNVYNEYVTHCREKNERPLEMNVFGTKLKERGIRKERIGRYGIREYCYIGIKLKSDLEEKNLALVNQ
jgi:hypothetical protein